MLVAANITSSCKPQAQIRKELERSLLRLTWADEKAFNIFFMYAVTLRPVKQTLMICVNVGLNSSNLNEQYYGIFSLKNALFLKKTI